MPTTSNDLKYWSPILVMRPSFSLPPLDLFAGVRQPPRGQAIAEAFDMKAWTAKSADELDFALAEAFKWRKGPCFIDVHVESIADRVPPVYSWLTKKGEDPLNLEAKEVAFL